MNELISNVLFALTAATYVAASVIFLRYLVGGKGDIGKLGPRLVTVGAVLHLGYILVASFVFNVCPVGGIHFSLSVGSMLMCAAYLGARKRWRIELSGAFIAPLALASLLASRFVGRGEPTESLKSTMLPIHVTLNLLGVALLSLAFSAAVLYLLQERLVKSKKIDGMSRRLPPLDALDRAEHKFLLAGFPLLTLGIITGTVWARHVETGGLAAILRAMFGFVTWAVIAGVLFLRAASGWRGRRAAYGTIAGFGFVVVVLAFYLFRKEPPHPVTHVVSGETPAVLSRTVQP